MQIVHEGMIFCPSAKTIDVVIQFYDKAEPRYDCLVKTIYDLMMAGF
jgi:hypothetical protein